VARRPEPTASGNFPLCWTRFLRMTTRRALYFLVQVAEDTRFSFCGFLPFPILIREKSHSFLTCCNRIPFFCFFSLETLRYIFFFPLFFLSSLAATVQRDAAAARHSLPFSLVHLRSSPSSVSGFAVDRKATWTFFLSVCAYTPRFFLPLLRRATINEGVARGAPGKKMVFAPSWTYLQQGEHAASIRLLFRGGYLPNPRDWDCEGEGWRAFF